MCPSVPFPQSLGPLFIHMPSGKLFGVENMTEWPLDLKGT